jgi:hypothetical protein
MAVMASTARFEQGGWYSSYGRYPFFAERAQWANGQTAAGNKIGVAGCGWGYLVDELRKLNRDAYGFDAASYATAKWIGIRPTEPSRVVVASALTRTQMTSFRSTTVGMAGSALIPLIVTEDLLPALTDAEVTTALTELRRIATKLIHVCTCAAPTTPGGTVAAAADVASRSADFNWKTHAAWKALVGTELVMNAEGGAVL